MKTHEQIEGLKKRHKELMRELEDTAFMLTKMGERQALVKAELRVLSNQLGQMQPKDLVVSDHALIRYAERQRKLPMESLREQIKEVLQGVKFVGEVKALGFVIKNNVVVTYAPAEAFVEGANEKA